jgi:hypothetical protein
MQPEPVFTFELEEDFSDEKENASHYTSRGLFFKSHEETQPEPEVLGEPNYVVAEEEVCKSYVSATLSTIQPLDGNRSLLILAITCHPAPERRFVHATIDWQFHPAPSPTPTPSPSSILGPSPNHSSSPPSVPASPRRFLPKIVDFGPHRSVGGISEEETRTVGTIAFPVKATFGPASIGIEPSLEKETKKVVKHAMSIMGSPRPGRRAYWTVEENKSSKGGIPSHLQLAVVVEHSGPFKMELKFKGKLGGGFPWPDLSVKAKKKLIDVGAWRYGEIGLEPGDEAWKVFLSEMTGEVPGMMRDFRQNIVRP